MSVIQTGTRPGEEEEEAAEEEEEEDKNSASKPRFHAQGWNKSFRATPLTLMCLYVYFVCLLLTILYVLKGIPSHNSCLKVIPSK